MKPDSDLSVVHRAGRIAAAQASLALAAVLLVVGAVVYFVDIRVQEQQIRSELSSVALAADDANDPPPGMILVLRDLAGKVEVSADGVPTAELLARPAGFSEAQIDGVPYRAVVMDKPEGRVVALLDLGPYKAGRSRLLLSLGIAELAGIVASIAVVSLLTRRSIRPLAEALALQRRFVADASHELRAPLTVLHTRVQLLARRFEGGDAEQTTIALGPTRGAARRDGRGPPVRRRRWGRGMAVRRGRVAAVDRAGPPHPAAGRDRRPRPVDLDDSHHRSGYDAAPVIIGA